MTHTIKAVIGSSYGDEGKGQMTDYFATQAQDRNQSCVVALTNGGAQRGHTVVAPDGRRHVFHHFGSGTFAGAHTYLPEYYIINPMIFVQEYQKLKDVDLKVYCHPLCKCSTPFDMMANQMIEESRGDNKHGSCGVGIWETIQRYDDGDIYLYQLADMSRNELRQYLFNIREYYEDSRLTAFDIAWKNWVNIFYSENLIEHYIDDLMFTLSHIEIADDNALKKYSYIIFENGQGLLLDQNNGDEDHSTPSNTGSENIHSIVTQTFNNYDLELCYVTRSYLTRHGNGPFAEECDVAKINPKIYDRTNIWNKHQGNIRYGMLDFEALKKRCAADAQKWSHDTRWTIAMTHLNEYEAPYLQHKDDILYASYVDGRMK